MRQSRAFAIVASLLFFCAVTTSPAHAASTVDVTYDLADTSLVSSGVFVGNFITWSNDRPLNGTIAGSMKVRYQSNSLSSMPIQTGPVSLLSLDLLFQDTTPSFTVSDEIASPRAETRVPFTGTLRWQLTTAANGYLTSNGMLTGLSGVVHNTFRLNCLATGGVFGSADRTCRYFFGLPAGEHSGASWTNLGAVPLSGQTGTYGSYTRHTLAGEAPLDVGFVPLYKGGIFFTDDRLDTNIVGREVLRAADGHDTKVIPEPGTLLLLAAGTAGLALVGRATRRTR